LGKQASTLRLGASFMMACTRKKKKELTAGCGCESLLFLKSRALLQNTLEGM